MKNVSTTAPRGLAASAIRQNYSKLVEPRLLNSWMSKPEEAPGRPVSSPWPERIDVTSEDVSGDAASVKGNIVEASSTGEFRRVPVEIRLVQRNGAWLITSFETKSEEPVPSDDRDAAVGVVREYYRAINARAYDTAYRCWGTSGPPGQSPKEFAAGFADTSRVEVMPGKPSQIGAAAGSRYVDVPVTVIATMKDGRTQRFSGTYTLRRSVVDGATIEQRKWHIYSASLRLAKS